MKLMGWESIWNAMTETLKMEMAAVQVVLSNQVSNVQGVPHMKKTFAPTVSKHPVVLLIAFLF